MMLINPKLSNRFICVGAFQGPNHLYLCFNNKICTSKAFKKEPSRLLFPSIVCVSVILLLSEVAWIQRKVFPEQAQGSRVCHAWLGFHEVSSCAAAP